MGGTPVGLPGFRQTGAVLDGMASAVQGRFKASLHGLVACYH